MLKWVADAKDRKPDFDLDDITPGQVVTIQIGKNKSFTGKWLYAYSLLVSGEGTLDFHEMPLTPGTWYARHRINGGKWQNVVTLTIV